MLRRLLPDAGADRRAELVDALDTFTDERVDHFWGLVGIINGWPAFLSGVGAFRWVIDALRAHPTPTG